MDDLMTDGQRLLGVKEARAFLNHMPASTFYWKIKRGLIPKARYLGSTPVWRLGDLRGVYDQLPDKPLPVNAAALSSSK